MIHRNVLAALATAGTLLLACGSSDLSDLCDKAAECATKAGKPFSKTECQNNANAEREKAETAGCGDQYQEYVDCVLSLDFQCSENIETKSNAECGSKVKAVNKCLN